MSLLEEILRKKDKPPCNEVPCNDCIYLIFPKKNLPFCKIKDKIILPSFPPNKCDLKESEGLE